MYDTYVFVMTLFPQVGITAQMFKISPVYNHL